MKNLKKLGKVLSTKEQKNVNGGGGGTFPNYTGTAISACIGKNLGDSCGIGTCNVYRTFPTLLLSCQ